MRAEKGRGRKLPKVKEPNHKGQAENRQARPEHLATYMYRHWYSGKNRPSPLKGQTVAF